MVPLKNILGFWGVSPSYLLDENVEKEKVVYTKQELEQAREIYRTLIIIILNFLRFGVYINLI